MSVEHLQKILDGKHLFVEHKDLDELADGCKYWLTEQIKALDAKVADGFGGVNDNILMAARKTKAYVDGRVEHMIDQALQPLLDRISALEEELKLLPEVIKALPAPRIELPPRRIEKSIEYAQDGRPIKITEQERPMYEPQTEKELLTNGEEGNGETAN